MQASSSVISTLTIDSDGELARVRQHVRRAAADLGMGLVAQTKLVTAVSELARNTLIHGGGGKAEIAYEEAGGRRGLRVVFTDRGPGIADVEQALSDGYTSGGGLGLGLSGARRLVHEFDIDSTPGLGTTIRIVMWAPHVPAPVRNGKDRTPVTPLARQ
ncbi:anti-sigma regulatory factor [Streptomyces sp. NPDC002952]|uniref:anti-sigma regulatory factor n=1 Tax=Streptomyces sp. NPDC002952 TaxID=3364673 RepID=UPI0036956979